MADIVNLKRARKARKRRTQEEKAAENRAHFGVAKAERNQIETLRDKAAQRIDSHKLDGENG